MKNPKKKSIAGYAKELKSWFENHPLIGRVEFVSPSYSTNLPMFIINSVHQEKSVSYGLFKMVWLGVSTMSFAIIPFWMHRDLNFYVKPLNVPVENEIRIRRTYTEVASVFLLGVRS